MKSPITASGDFHTAKIRARYNLSPQLALDEDREAFIEDLRICLNDPRSANPESFEKYRIDTLVDFLTKSHAFYLHYAIPSLLRSIDELIRTQSVDDVFERASKVLMRGFTRELKDHFTHEENYLFKYALQLNEDRERVSIPYSLNQFKKEHDSFLIDLEKIIAFFEIYRNELAGNMAFRILFQQLENLKADMDLHGLIEDQVLLPKIEKLES